MKFFKYLVFTFLVFSFSQTVKPFGADLTEEEQIALAKLMSLEVESKRIQEESKETEEEAELKRAIQMSLEPQAKDKQLSPEEQKKVDDMLWKGIDDLDVELVKKALNLQANPNNIKSSYCFGSCTYNTPLTATIKITKLSKTRYKKGIDMIKLLLNSGADINLPNHEGTPLILASYGDSGEFKDIVKLLLDAGANPNIQDNTGAIALMRTENYEIMELLLNSKADPNIQDKYGHTVLMDLTQQLKPGNLLKLLIDSDANPNITNNAGKTALDIAEKDRDYKDYYPGTEIKVKEAKAILKDAQEKWRQAVIKKIIETTPLIPELADIVSEYSDGAKLEITKSKE